MLGTRLALGELPASMDGSWRTEIKLGRDWMPESGLGGEGSLVFPPVSLPCSPNSPVPLSKVGISRFAVTGDISASSSEIFFQVFPPMAARLLRSTFPFFFLKHLF